MRALLTTLRKHLMSPCSVFIFSARIGTAFGVEPQHGAVEGDFHSLLIIVVKHQIINIGRNGEGIDFLIAAVGSVVGHFLSRPCKHMGVFIRPIVTVDRTAPTA